MAGKRALKTCIVAGVAFIMLASTAAALVVSRNAEAGVVTRAASAADMTILGLDTRDYTKHMSKLVSLSDRQWVRHHKIVVRWSDIHKAKNTFDFSYYNKEINARLADGAQSLLLLLQGPTPEWARDPAYGAFSLNAPPLDWSDWYRFCAEVAERYGSVVDFYEIWNEPGWDRDAYAYNQWRVYHFGGQVETDYLPMLQTAYTAIKEKDPSGQVMCGALIYTLDQNPNTGADLTVQLFDEVNRPGQDVSMKVTSSKPVVAERPMYFNYKGARDGGHDVLGATAAGKQWYFAEGTTRDGFEEWLCLQNPNPNPIQVTATFMFGPGQGENSTMAFNLDPTSRTTFKVNDLVGPGKDVSVRITSASDFIAERPMYFNYNGAWSGGHCVVGAKGSSSTWYFAEGCTGYSIQQYLCLQNPHPEGVTAEITFMMTKGEVIKRTVDLGPNSRTTFDINMLIGFHGSSDMLAIHPYKDFWNWGEHYAYFANEMRAHNIWHEVAVTEVGTPHHSDDQPGLYNESMQAEAIGAVGVGGLFGAGCKKIWIYRDIDEEPGTSWDHVYYGLFKYTGEPHPSWFEYKNWQQRLPSYPNLPASL